MQCEIALVVLITVTNVLSSSDNYDDVPLDNSQGFNASADYVSRLATKYVVFSKDIQNSANESLKVDSKNLKNLMPFIQCLKCKTVIAAVKVLIKLGFSDTFILNRIRDLCSTFAIASKDVCDGGVQRFGAQILYVLRHSSLGISEMCSFMLEGTCPNDFARNHKWDVTLPPNPKPTPHEIPIPNLDAPRLKVLHLSDVHFDPEYVEGANANCADPLCCRKKSGTPAKAEDRAGKWGDYRKCDSPERIIDHLCQHIVSTHPDIDYIMWTGDIPPHDVWEQTQQGNMRINKDITKKLFQYFPHVPIFSNVGNHESAPVNSFPPHFLSKQNISVSWLYDEVDALWKQGIPTNVSPTVRKGAYYSALVKPGFRIISINSNYCNNKNFWLFLNSTDPDNGLQWLISELQMAEMANEKVHIVGHIPPGSEDCLEVWSRNFYKIIGRYESTVRAQFYGHTHYDELEIFFDPANLVRPTNIAYVVPSVTTYYDLNPGYRIYYVDGDHNETTRIVTDHETWVMDLKKANAEDHPVWYKLYSAKSAYGMESLRPVDWDVTIKHMAKNSSLFDLYYKHYWKDSHLRPACNVDCQKQMLCAARSGRSHDQSSFCPSKIAFKYKSIWDSMIFGGVKSTSNSTSFLGEIHLLIGKTQSWFNLW